MRAKRQIKRPAAAAKVTVLKDLPALCLALLVIVGVALWVAGHTGTNFLSHSVSDSYTLQALAWREGQVKLAQDYPWLELAVYEGAFYVSFPPVPTIPMWLLSFPFGANTPNSLMTLLYLLSGCAAAFYLARRYMNRAHAAVLTVFIALGGSILDITVSGRGLSGAVWYQAQLLAFLLTMLSFLLIESKRGVWKAVSLVCIALAVGCRPNNGIYVPFLLFMLYRGVKKKTLAKTLAAMLPYVVVPALIACAYGAYNYARFGNPLEFGHRYLPEFTRSGDSFFDTSRLWHNLQTIFRAPEMLFSSLFFFTTGGFAVYLTNPMFVLGFGRMIEQTVERKAGALEAVLFVSILAHAFSLLLHRTNGGWQYGTRYLIDVVPALVYLFARGKKPIRLWESLPMGALALFNVYGCIVFQQLSK